MDEMMIQRQDAAEAAARESYVARRASLETYFDRTAVDAWSNLTSNVKVSGIRATVRRVDTGLHRLVTLSLHRFRLGG